MSNNNEDGRISAMADTMSRVIAQNNEIEAAPRFVAVNYEYTHEDDEDALVIIATPSITTMAQWLRVKGFKVERDDGRLTLVASDVKKLISDLVDHGWFVVELMP